MANELKKVEKNVVDQVGAKIKKFAQEGQLSLPANYSPENAMKAAWLALQEVKDRNGKLALETCTTPSISNALLDMVVQGLSPAKKQCYFVVYGNKLQLMRSYFGTMAVTKRLKGVETIRANCIYEGDEFEFEVDIETATKVITKHEQAFENIDPDKLKGAYATVITSDGSPDFTEIMTMAQIRKAWGQGATKGKSPAHTNFADQMALKTVINRACKGFANTSDDSDLLIDAYNRTTANEYEPEPQTIEDVQDEVKQEIKEAESKVIDVPEEAQEIVEEPEQLDLTGTPFVK